MQAWKLMGGAPGYEKPTSSWPPTIVVNVDICSQSCEVYRRISIELLRRDLLKRMKTKRMKTERKKQIKTRQNLKKKKNA